MEKKDNVIDILVNCSKDFLIIILDRVQEREREKKENIYLIGLFLF